MRGETGRLGKWRRRAGIIVTARAAGIPETRWTPPAITSPTQAVHQELVRKLAEQARINRLRDQLHRARPGAALSSPGWPGIATPSPAGPGAAVPTSGDRVPRSRRPSRHPPHFLP